MSATRRSGLRFSRTLISLAAPALVVALVIAPLVVGTAWMYRASAAAFELQHDVRVAQNTRDRVMKAFLGNEAEVRGFAATDDSYFSRRFEANDRNFDVRSLELSGGIRRIGIVGASGSLARERLAFHRWVRDVAAPIIAHPRARAPHLLRDIDPLYTAEIVSDDRRIGALLDDTAARSENDRQRLLRHILFGSVLLVGLVATTVTVLLFARARAQRREPIQRTLYADEQRITTMLQLALTPAGLPKIRGVSFDAIYVPAGSELHVGGDWYEAFELSDGRIFLIIGDVAGHGLEAAVTMNRARQALLAAAVMEPVPATVLMRANRALCERSAGMVTVACCIFDQRSRELTYATAGHPAPVVASPFEAARSLAYGGAPLGIANDIRIESFTETIEPHAMLVLYTDGLTEQDRDVIAGECRLLSIVRQNLSATDAAAAIYDATIGPSEPRDDVAILTMRVDSADGERS